MSETAQKTARPTYHYVIFDFDGTLVHTQPTIINSLRKTFDDLAPSYPIAEETLRTALRLGLTLPDTFRYLAPELIVDQPVLDRFVGQYREVYAKKNWDFRDLFEGVHEVLEELAQYKTKLMITSNKGEQAIHAILEKFNLQGLIDLVIGEQVNVEKKPSPDLFEKIIKPYYPEIDLAKTIMIGDTATDLMFAKNLGIDSCWAAYGYGDPTECEALKPTFTIRRLSELKEKILPTGSGKEGKIKQQVT